MKIHPVTHTKGDKNRFCGPAAISILTGMSTGEAARLIRHISGKKSVMGTSTTSVRRALAMCGAITTPSPTLRTGPAPTLAQWLKDTVKSRTAGRVFLLVARNHWQVISGRRYCCGQTGAIISIADKGCRKRARVTEVYEVTVPKAITIPLAARKPAASAKADPNRLSLAKLERKFGFKGKIEIDSGFKDYVVPPCAAFPRGFSTLHHGWDETLSRVEYCLDPAIYETEADDQGHVSF